jgi:alpha-L-fucosidase 2
MFAHPILKACLTGHFLLSVASAVSSNPLLEGPNPFIPATVTVANAPGDDTGGAQEAMDPISASEIQPLLNPSEIIWFEQPARAWTEGLPVGNGRLGGVVHGGTARESIPFNEDTLWTGQPHDYAHDGAHEALDDLRRLLRDGKQTEAHALANERFMSKPFGQQAYQPFGEIRLQFPGHERASGYWRSLDIGNALAVVRYEVGEASYRREIFASEPDQALIVHLTAEGGTLDFSVSLGAAHEKHTVTVEGDEIVLRGSVNDYPKAEERGRTPYPQSALNFEARLKVIPADGRLIADAEAIQVEGATEVTLQLVGATNFINFQDISADPARRCAEHLKALTGRSYGELKAAHTEDYHGLYGRVSMDLGQSELSFRPTDQRVATFPADADPNLVALVFQYGRYLLIASSRPGTQPANLQGIWNDQLLPPWDSKYTTNINVEMNYWPAEVTNLPELAQPLIQMVRDLSDSGRSVARAHYDLPGWVTHHNTDLWRGAAPINNSDHGIWPTGGAWLCQHLWWHYQFNGDQQFLEATVYPILKEASRFFAGYLVTAPDFDDWLISGPSNSPETGGLVMGPTMDHQIIRSLFSHTIEAARLLDVDSDFARELEAKHARIAPNQIGQYGQLQEWLEDRDDPRNTHRHISHLWGLFPGNEIHLRTAPKLAEASRVTLEHRGKRGDGWRMGWSAAWKINFLARLLDGDAAFLILKELISPAINDSKKDSSRQRLHMNIFDANPPFQIEENFGATSGIAELLLQSHLRTPDGAYYQDILPALPSALPKGDVSGLKGRGGFEFHMVWSAGQLTSLEVTSLLGNPLHIRYRGGAAVTETKAGLTYAFTAADFIPAKLPNATNEVGTP